MTQADTALTGAHSIVPTGKSFEISRRSMLGAVAVLPLAGAPPATLAGESPFLAKMRRSRESANATFWRMHAEARALEDAWDADPDDSDENWERHSEGVRVAYERALMQAVFCPAAVLAKLKVTGFDPAGYALPAPVKTADRIIEWDLQRCAQANWFPNPNV